MSDKLQPVRVTCPGCKSIFRKFATEPWGEARTTGPVQPFVCSRCAFAGLINFVSGELVDVGEEGWELLRVQNPVLHAAVQAARERVRERQGIRTMRAAW